MTAAVTDGTEVLPTGVVDDIDALRPLHESVLRDEHPTPTADQLAAAHRLATLVWKQELDPRATDPCVGGIVTCAGHVFGQALMRLSLKKAPLQHMLARVMDRRWNVPIGTAAVSLNPKTDRVTLWVNPFLVLALGPEQSTFVVGHEARHLLHGHLLVEKDLAKDQLFTLASEITINARITGDLGTPMPSIDGETIGIDPVKEFERYRDAARKAGLAPVDKDTFLSSDEDCYRALLTLPKPPRQKQASCAHADGVSEQGSSGQDSSSQDSSSQGTQGESSASPGTGTEGASREDGTGNGLYDQPGFGGGLEAVTAEEVSDLVDAVLHQAIKEAVAGNQDLKNELLALGEQFPDSKAWGSIGLGRLRGEQPRTSLTSYWEQYVARATASRLAPSDRLEYNKKIGWWYPFFTPTGREAEWEVAVFFDASGSISGPLIERMTALMGTVPNARVTWHSFDTEVYDLGVTQDGYGEIKPINGGGGTDFAPIYEKVASLEEEPDMVIVVTDGYAAKVVPADTHKYLWLVTAGGDAWMADHGMDLVVVDEDFAQAA